jgi:hypothetical protein
MAETYFVSLDLQSAMNVIEEAVLGDSFTGEQIDHYESMSPHGGFIMLVYEKNYMRVSNRLTLTVLLDNCTGVTRVHTVSGGGGEGLFRFDFGAAEAFEKVVKDALSEWRKADKY